MDLTSQERLEIAEKSLKHIDEPQGVMQSAVFSIAMSLSVIAEVALENRKHLADKFELWGSVTDTPDEEEGNDDEELDLPDLDEDESDEED